MMVVRANAMVHNAPSPQLSQMLLDLLNKRLLPWCSPAARWVRVTSRNWATSELPW